MTVVKLCIEKTFQLLTGVPANTDCLMSNDNGHKMVAVVLVVITFQLCRLSVKKIRILGLRSTEGFCHLPERKKS